MNAMYAMCMLLLAGTSAAGKVVVNENQQTGLISWRYTDENFSLQLIQLPPDYVSAFYAARGLRKDLVEYMRQQCIFGTIVRNLSKQALQYQVSEWRYIAEDGEEYAVPGKADWVGKWAGMGSAFQWSILPDQQVFANGDWSQGFTALPVSHGARLDFNFTWKVGAVDYKAEIKGVRCAGE